MLVTPSGNKDDGLFKAFDRTNGRTNVCSFRVVVPSDAGTLLNEHEPVFYRKDASKSRTHNFFWHITDIGDGDGRQSVFNVVDPVERKVVTRKNGNGSTIGS